MSAAIEPLPRTRRIPTGVLTAAGVALEVVVLLGLWELAISTFHIWSADLIPAPSAIWAAFTDMIERGTLQENLWFSVKNVMIGFSLAVVAGIAIGLALGASRHVEEILGPPFWTAFNTPKSAIQPLLVLWLGFGPGPKILIIFLMVLFPVAINTWEGLKRVEVSQVNAARVFGANRRQVFFKVQLWGALPLILTGVRMGVSRAMVGIVVGEFIGGSEGLGFLIMERSGDSDLAGALAVTGFLVAMGAVGMALVSVVRRIVAPWYSEGAETH